jgi:hypothetical protein
MGLKLLTLAAASIALAACSKQGADFDSYLYPDFWGARMAGVSGSSHNPDNQGVANAATAPADTGIFGTHVESSYTSSIWIFPPDTLGGGN